MLEELTLLFCPVPTAKHLRNSNRVIDIAGCAWNFHSKLIIQKFASSDQALWRRPCLLEKWILYTSTPIFVWYMDGKLLSKCFQKQFYIPVTSFSLSSGQKSQRIPMVVLFARNFIWLGSVFFPATGESFKVARLCFFFYLRQISLLTPLQVPVMQSAFPNFTRI